MKKILALGAAVLLSVLAVVAGFFAVGGIGAYSAVGSGLDYRRAEVTEIVARQEKTSSYDIVFRARLLSGKDKGAVITATQNAIVGDIRNARDVSVGDRVVVFCGGTEEDEWFFGEYLRSDILLVLGVLFVVCLLIFGRAKGVKTVLSLALTLAAVFCVLVPAVYNCHNLYLWSVLVCAYIVVMTLAIVNGFSRLSAAAMLGCLSGVLVSAALLLVTDSFTRLTGITDECSIYLLYVGNNGTVDLKALTFAAILIGAIGAVMDVAVNIAASLHEIAVKVQKPTFGELCRSGFTIGRDIVGTMSNTLILAYIGSSMCSLLLYVHANGDSLLNLFNRQQIVVEMLKILVGSMGILLTLPMTTVIAAWLYSRPRYAPRLQKLHTAEKQGDPYIDELTHAIKDGEGE